MQKIPITLDDVFGFWRANEAWNQKWQQVAKEKGFPDWESWRRKYLKRLAETTEPGWTLELIENPLEVVPEWYGGPFMGWIKDVYAGQSAMTFGEIIKQPFMEGHDYIPGLVANFPKLTVLSVVEDETGKVFVVEGMHRVCALTVMAQEQQSHIGIVFTARGRIKPAQKLTFDIQP